MDFLDPKKRRAHKIRLYIGYTLMAVLLLSVTTLLVFQAYGYNFNPRTGVITQNGLVFVDAHPRQANVTLNGRSRGQTDQRLVLPADNYSLELGRDGYRPWKRDFTLEGGKIERFVYPFLFPEQLETNQVELYGQEPAFATQSPDRRWLLVQRPGGVSSFDLVDLNAETPTTASLTLPSGLMTTTGSSHKLELVEWSTNNRHVLVKHTFTRGSEFVLIDRQTAGSSVNISETFDQAFTSISLRDKRFDRYYLYNKPDKTLHTAVLQTQASQLLLKNVLQYRSHGSNVLLYIMPSGSDKSKVVATVFDNNKSYPIKELPANDQYLLDVASFEDKWYMVAGASGEGKIYVYRDPVAALQQDSLIKLVPAAILRIEKAEYVSFSNNARFIAVQGGRNFAVYDAEDADTYRYDTKLKLSTGQKAAWMDGHRLSLVSKGKIEVFDFDGTNRQTLSASSLKFGAFFDRDYTALYTLGPAPNLKDRSALLRTELLTAADR